MVLVQILIIHSDAVRLRGKPVTRAYDTDAINARVLYSENQLYQNISSKAIFSDIFVFIQNCILISILILSLDVMKNVYKFIQRLKH